MKRVVIAALVCLNIALALALVFSVNQPAAYAQFRGNADYMLVTGKVGSSVDAVYVLDVVQQKLVAFEPDPAKNYRLLITGARMLKNDFSSGKE